MTSMVFTKKKKIITACFIMVIAMILTACSGSDAGGGNSTLLPAEGEMAVHFIDVGQADCTLLISEGETMLIDAGNQPDDDLIIGYLDDLGIDRLKYIVFTHPHEDHIGSGESLINAFDVEKIFMLDEYDDGIEGYLREEIEYLGIETEAPYPG
ncbi:MAG: MBL fold metallo-hydrolase, partial [Firmicutes bacterium]|nr:MBL fold metallo-hydrolase [Bacillota bacterium]